LSELLYTNIKILEILDSESNKETVDDKYNRVDLKVRDEHEKIILIELQYNRQMDFLQRLLYSSSKAITEHMKEGFVCEDVVKVISINILYFDLAGGEDYIYKGNTKYFGIHNNKELQLSPNQQKAFNIQNVSDIYPEYYLIEVTRFNDVAKNTLDEWIYFLKNEDIKDNFSAKGIKEAKQKLDVMKMSEQERTAYDRHIYQVIQDRSMLHSQYSEGKIEGKQEGIKIGIEKGKKDREIEIAKSLIKQNIPLDVISKTTGLTLDEILTLSKR
jgi:predicted transposase/invertase (TIGR01784 family)